MKIIQDILLKDTMTFAIIKKKKKIGSGIIDTSNHYFNL